MCKHNQPTKTCNKTKRSHSSYQQCRAPRPYPTSLNKKILPLDSMIKYSNLRFMHSYFHHDLPFSFEQLWIPNRDHLPNRVLRNANDLRIHHTTTCMRLSKDFLSSLSPKFGMKKVPENMSPR